ncbi:MAG: class I SAM-dependent methyltransferase [Lachnospiraceae bacterium]|nr:class I SAM-dependent methyltransferase [Lachnospiraceae bacterium]
MKNPWKEIDLTDYENHMSLDSVQQLQSLNHMMKNQFYRYSGETVMVLGIAGGNGLQHVDKKKFSKIYGVDINDKYLNEVKKRYSHLNGMLECVCLDLMNESEKLPHADIVIANLLIEYIGYECFQNAIKQIEPRYVSCIIQINVDDSFVSDSPYLHAFDRLDEVHHPMDEYILELKMGEIGYQKIFFQEQHLPNGKKLVRLDFILE